jgi:exopolysaccharide biosynthesis polyprenyl glycosylphosphotransferase
MGMSLDERFIKRVVDLSVSTMVMVVFLPIYILVAILVKLSSKGPAIFRQDRVTKNNKVFGLYKFRTMVVGAEKDTGPVFATTGDERLTRIGVLLRRSRLDELPQLWHVFTGTMSLVGPRPERPYFIEQCKDEIPNFEQRLRVKAGITGLAQVMGKYSTKPSNKLRYDLMYINNYSIWLDLKIMIQTIGIIFMGEKAKGLDAEEEARYIEQIETIITRTHQNVVEDNVSK